MEYGNPEFREFHRPTRQAEGQEEICVETATVTEDNSINDGKMSTRWTLLMQYYCLPDRKLATVSLIPTLNGYLYL
jgi:hypothetical protein